MPVIRIEPLVTGHPACQPVTILAEPPEVSNKVTVLSHCISSCRRADRPSPLVLQLMTVEYTAMVE